MRYFVDLPCTFEVVLFHHAQGLAERGDRCVFLRMKYYNHQFENISIVIKKFYITKSHQHLPASFFSLSDIILQLLQNWLLNYVGI